jgi:putative tricarboxylic transport membrane protein
MASAKVVSGRATPLGERPIRRPETMMNLVWVAAGLGIAGAAIPTGIWTGGGPGSGFLGFAAGLAIAAAGALLLASGEQADRIFRPDAAAARRILAVIGGLCAMALLIPLLGFILAAILTLVVLLRLIERQGWAAILTFSIASTLIVWWVFDWLLGSTLPRGPLGF